MKKPLTPNIEEKIQTLGIEGRKSWSKGNIEDAENIFLRCWAEIPEPKFEYDYSQILSGGLVRFYRDSRQLEKASHWIDVMKKAYNSNTDIDIEFMEATVYYEAKELDKAYEIFATQYKNFGKRPFEGEDKKYLTFTLNRNKGQ